MKISKLLVILLAIFFSANVQAQSPQSINYQAVVRDANGVVVMNRVVSFRLSILTGGSTGTPQYVETHNATTNTFGLVTLNIGLGTPTTGAMSAVTWATGSKFLRVEVDINGGSNFTTLGTTQFLSVPYALYAATSGTSAASGWGLSGNTVTSANYIGTNNLEDVRFYSSGTQKMVLKTSGYVGIGTNTPDFKMVIENDAESTAGIDDGRTLLQLHNKSFASYATTNLRIKTGNTSNVTMISHYGPTYTQYPNFADYGLMLSTGPGLMMQAPAGNIRFMTGPAPNNVGIYDRMVITNDGNVGIGTTTPTARFHNAGSARFEGLSTNNSASRILVADISGNLALRDVSTISGGGSSSGWSLTGNTTTAGSYIGTNNSDDVRINTEGTQKMVVKTSGYVGIGTNTPDFKMVIENDAFSTAGIDDGRTLLQLHNKSFASYATTNLRIKTGNTSNVTMLAHYGPTYTQYPNFADYGLMLSTGPGLMMQAPAGNIRFMTGPAPNNVGINDRMVITNEGNVGIGTTTPKAKLEVTNGDVYVNDATKGIILKSPNGGCWRVTMDNTGNFVRTSIACPN